MDDITEPGVGAVFPQRSLYGMLGCLELVLHCS